MNTKKDLAIIILAAGQGKRMKNPDIPKVLAELNSKPLISYVLDVSLQLNPTKICTIIGHKKELVEDYLKNNYSSVEVAYQLEQLGTGHAVMQANGNLTNFDGNVLILCGDVPLLQAKTIDTFINNHQNYGANLSVLTAVTENPTGYGRIVRNEAGEFYKITEEKDANEFIKKIKEINSGIFLVNSRLLFDALGKISNTNAQGEYYLTDIVEVFVKEKLKCAAFIGVSFDELQGINSPDDLERATKYMNNFMSVN
jgi:UDP-N-acetylglucosamine diphosphorylase/glucosamine-1-phosphate N-acetyltransferase